MTKEKNFNTVGSALAGKTNSSKENFRRSYNAKHTECQAYEASKQEKNQQLVDSLQALFKKFNQATKGK